VVDNLAKRREALPHLAGIYFVTPTEQSARLILEDWKARAPLCLFFLFSFFSKQRTIHFRALPGPRPTAAHRRCLGPVLGTVRGRI